MLSVCRHDCATGGPSLEFAQIRDTTDWDEADSRERSSGVEKLGPLGEDHAGAEDRSAASCRIEASRAPADHERDWLALLSWPAVLSVWQTEHLWSRCIGGYVTSRRRLRLLME